MDELRRNGSGYYEPTAFKAMKNIEREEKEVEVRKGEIWEVEMGNNIRTVLVLAVHGSYSTVLTFSDDQRERRTVQMNAQGMKYTEPGMVTYKFHDAFDKFIRLATDEEFGNIMDQVAGALGIETEVPFGIVESKEVQRLQMEITDMKRKNEKMFEERNRLLAELDGLKREQLDAMKAMIERDLYKSLYEQTFERLIG